VMPASRARC